MKGGSLSSANHPRGIIKNSKGIALTTIGLPMSDHFFQATSFKVVKVGTSLHMIFGAQTADPDSDDDEFRLAIEIVYPIEMAAKFIYDINWLKKAAGGTDPFATVVERSVRSEIDKYVVPKKYKVPKGANYRSFPSNFSIMSVSTGQSAIEFFEAPPGMLVEAMYQHTGWRPNSDVKAILTVILPPIELLRLLRETREILKDTPISVEDQEENHV